MQDILNSQEYKAFCKQRGFAVPSASIKALTAYLETHKETPRQARFFTS